jgi:hypothetical protein
VRGSRGFETRRWPDQSDGSAWGTAFIDALGRLGMPAFAELPLRYVGPILMHAGIPSPMGS